jgi:glycosyltransferase involved in cell wall biosynthesis
MSGLAYIIGTFPTLTETFILGEIQALEETGVTVELFSLRRPSTAHAGADAAELAARTVYGPSLSARELWAANWQSFRREPGRYLRALGAVLARTALNPVHCLKSLGLFPVAAFFAEQIRARGVRHVHGHWANYPATAAYVVARLLDIPYSFTAHAYDASIVRAMIPEKIRRAAFISTCTAWNQRFLTRLVPEAGDKIIVNHHGAILDRFTPLRAPRIGSPETLTIISCGSLYPRKGFPYLLAACRLLRDRGHALECRIIGEGPMRSDLQRFIDRHQLGGCVRLLGALPHREVIRQYRDADLFVLACITDHLGWQELFTDPVLLMEVGLAIPFRPLTDGIPNVLVEAMAMEIPVVSTHVAGIPELIADGVTGTLVPERDARALAAAIEGLRADPEGRRAMALRGREVVHERFDRLKNIRELVATFSARGSIQPHPRELHDARPH